jgi:ornithine carbamoyltransferase
MPKRDFLAIPDLSPAELLALFDLAARMKGGTYRDRPLQGKTLAMIFAKSSAGTRSSSLPATSSSAGASRSVTPRGC